MLPAKVLRKVYTARPRLAQMANHLSNGSANGAAYTTLADIKKTNNFTSYMPADPSFPTPAESHNAPRKKLHPRMVRNALFTYVRPVPAEEPELLGVSSRALRDIGLNQEEANSEELKEVVAGNKFYWEEDGENKQGKGVYPWAQCYGGFQFGNWAGQLGDGRAISLFETTNPQTGVRYELQLKGAGKTPYSRFADGRAVLRSSIREFVVSEYLNAIGIPTTRALALTMLPKLDVVRERLEPGAIVCRFAQSWLRLGTFDLLRSRGDRDNIRKLATYIAEEVFGGWDKLPARVDDVDKEHKPQNDSHLEPARGVGKDELQGPEANEQNRFARLYREIVRRNAKTVAAWQAYGFMNGVLNTDNTSVYGLSLDFGPFAFMDNFDPSHTPNHDDQMLRYAYRAQPTIIWWNLVRLGETLGELIGAGERVDQELFIEKGVEEDFAPILIKRAENVIDAVGEEYKAVFLSEYRRLMTARLGLKTQKQSDFDKLFSDLLDIMEALELDFNHFFRRLSTIKVADIGTDEDRSNAAKIFAHSEGVTGLNESEESLREKVGKWLVGWRERVVEDWGEGDEAEKERQAAMKSVNPNFVPRSWLLDEVIERVEKKNDRKVLGAVMEMTLDPFKDSWEQDQELAKRFTGDVPRFKRSIQCSCSS